MEWSGGQQLLFLGQSAVIGICVGFLFDCFSGYFRGRAYRWQLFVADVLMGALAALITFFGALVIMDGHLHPLLFAGVGIGFLAEHYMIGRWLSRLLCRVRTWMRRGCAAVVDFSESMILRFFDWMRKMTHRKQKMSKKPEKIRKKSRFFQKKS